MTHTYIAINSKGMLCAPQDSSLPVKPKQFDYESGGNEQGAYIDPSYYEDLKFFQDQLKDAIESAPEFRPDDYRTIRYLLRVNEQIVPNTLYPCPEGFSIKLQWEFQAPMKSWIICSEDEAKIHDYTRVYCLLIPDSEIKRIDPTPSETVQSIIDASERVKQEIIEKVGFQKPQSVCAMCGGKGLIEGNSSSVSIPRPCPCTEITATINPQPSKTLAMDQIINECNFRDTGVPGCTYGDTEFDSVSFAEGFNAGLDFIKEKAQSLRSKEEKHLLDFATWYSGMAPEKVQKAYERYLRETKTYSK